MKNLNSILRYYFKNCLYASNILSFTILCLCFSANAQTNPNDEYVDTMYQDYYSQPQNTIIIDSTASETNIISESTSENSSMSGGSCSNTPQWTQIGSTDNIYKCNPAGNVGIGTTSPTAKLDIVSTTIHNGIRANSPTFLNSRFIDISSTSSNNIRGTSDFYVGSQYGSIVFQPAATKKYVYLDGDLFSIGKVGIGNTNPAARLHISGTFEDKFFIDGGVSGTSMVLKTGAFGGLNNVIRFRGGGNPSPDALVIGMFEHVDRSIVLRTGGNVGIGTIAPTHKLTVAGTIAACEVIVENTWCDYVFEPDYNLKSLDEVEKFIIENRHLPGIPAEKTVIDKGLNLGDMQKMQMEKIEELTLYMIELNKKVTQLEDENKLLKERISK